MSLMRWDIINHLIKQNNYKSYLEIGYYKGWSFDRIECGQKIAVDPNPCKTPEEQSFTGTVYGLGTTSLGGQQMLFKMTSDDYFKLQETGDKNVEVQVKFDIIFIDGLHKSEQVDRDIQNALKHLSPGGTIVLHDCNPSSYEMTTTGTAAGEWTGDVYRAFIKARTSPLFYGYVIDTDYGVGILTPLKASEEDDLLASVGDVNYQQFDTNRKAYLNLISPEEFLKRETHAEAIPGE